MTYKVMLYNASKAVLNDYEPEEFSLETETVTVVELFKTTHEVVTDKSLNLYEDMADSRVSPVYIKVFRNDTMIYSGQALLIYDLQDLIIRDSYESYKN